MTSSRAASILLYLNGITGLLLGMASAGCAPTPHSSPALTAASQSGTAECIGRVKARMLEGVRLKSTEETPLTTEGAAINEAIQGGAPLETHYILKHSGGPQINGLTINRVYDRNGDRLDVMQELVLARNPEGDRDILTFKLTVLESEKGLPRFTIEQNMQLDDRCSAGVVSVERLSFGAGSKTMKVKKQTYYYSSKETSIAEEKTVPRANFDHLAFYRDTFDVREIQSLVGKKPIGAFLDFDEDGSELSFSHLPQKQSRPHPLTHASTETDVYEISAHQDSLHYKLIIYPFEGGEYATLDVPDLHITEDTVDRPTWQKTSLVKADESVMIEGFSESDFLKPELHYELTSNMALPNLHEGPYFSNIRLDEQKSTEGSYVYQVGVNVLEFTAETQVPRRSAVSASERATYLKETKYLQVSNPEIQRHVGEIKRSGFKTEHDLVKAILDHTHQLLKNYDSKMAANSDTVRTLTTDEIIQRQSGVCQHFSALFVTLARAAGLPARIRAGYSLSATVAVAHAWVEVLLDGSTWFPLDPQLSSTLQVGDAGYLPLWIDTLYEVQPGQAEDLGLEGDAIKLRLKIKKL